MHVIVTSKSIGGSRGGGGHGAMPPKCPKMAQN